jgi:hypothetical protein
MRTPSKLRRNVLILAGLVVLFTLTGFFLAPVIVKSQLEKRLSAELGRRVTVEKVRVNPYALSLTLEQFAIREPDGTSPFVTWRTLYVNADILGPIWRELTLREVVLDGFDIRVGVKADRSLTFADIIAKLRAGRARGIREEEAPRAPRRPAAGFRCAGGFHGCVHRQTLRHDAGPGDLHVERLPDGERKRRSLSF